MVSESLFVVCVCVCVCALRLHSSHLTISHQLVLVINNTFSMLKVYYLVSPLQRLLPSVCGCHEPRWWVHNRERIFLPKF